LIQAILQRSLPLAATLVVAAWLWIAPPGLLGKLDAIGYAVCHRIPERSFHLDDRPLPLCARCSGTFSAAAITLLVLAIIAPRRSGMPAPKFYPLFGVLFLAFAIDGGNSYLYLIKQVSGAFLNVPNLYLPNNALRLLTGTGMGMIMALMLWPAFHATIWQHPDPAPTLERWRDFLGLYGLLLGVDLLVLSEHPFVLYPLALFGPLGVLALLTMIFTVLWQIVMRQENTLIHVRQIGWPLLAGFTLALLMILTIDLIRLQLTGTWYGLSIGPSSWIAGFSL